MKGIEQYFVACEQAHLVCNSREYLSGGSRRVEVLIWVLFGVKEFKHETLTFHLFGDTRCTLRNYLAES